VTLRDGSVVVLVGKASVMTGGGTVAKVEGGGRPGAEAAVVVVAVVVGGVNGEADSTEVGVGEPMLSAIVAPPETLTSVHEVSVPICAGRARLGIPSPNSPPAVFAPHVHNVPSPRIAAE
jgi:hypothetical protein